MTERRHVIMLITDPSCAAAVTVESGALLARTIDVMAGETTVLAAMRGVFPAVGLGGPVLDCYIDQTTAPDIESEQPAAVAAVIHIEAPAGWTVPDDGRWTPFADVSVDVPPGVRDYVRLKLEELGGRRAASPLAAPWVRPGWFERAIRWIDEALVGAGFEPADTIAQARHWGISAIMLVDSPSGRLWFKATSPYFTAEVAVTALLSDAIPGATADVIASDAAQGWMLTRDLGDRLVSVDMIGTELAVARLVALQRALRPRVGEFLAAGVQHRPLAAVPIEFAEALRSPIAREHLAVSDDRIDQLVAWLTAAIDQVDALGLPDTVVHGDFHPGNVALVEDRAVLFDWSDSAISNPLVDIAAWASWFTDDTAEVDRLWELFIAAWTDTDPLDPALIRATRRELDGLIGAYHTISYSRLLAAVEPIRRIESLDGLTGFFAMAERAFAAG
jgi:Phosphotransferase enzyme family